MKFAYPYRILLSGSSGAGKTFIAKQILINRHLFQKKTKRVVYFYPCYLDQKPVNWDEDLGIPITYRVGIPSQDDIDVMLPDTTIVLDDTYDEAIQSTAIDHLFRVNSGKKFLNVLIMTQNNFAAGKYGRNIRNNCNITILLRNCLDTRINKTVCSQAGLQKAYMRAKEDLKNQSYPYMFLDQSPRAHASGYRLYTNIFDKYPTVYSESGMKGRVVPDSDFSQIFNIEENGKTFEASLKNEDEIKISKCKTKEVSRKKKAVCDSFSDDSSSSEPPPKKSSSRRKQKKPKKYIEVKKKRPSKKKRRREPSTSSSSDSSSSGSSSSDSYSTSSSETSKPSHNFSNDSESDSGNLSKRRKCSSVLSESSGISS